MIDKLSKLGYNESMNIEIYNYLNLINFKLAKLYKNGLYKPFSDGFELTKEMIKERLIFSQIEIKLPDFIYEEKRNIKKYFKNSRKNIKKLLKNSKKSEFSEFFDNKFEKYLIFRLKLTNLLLHDFRRQDFEEEDAVLQIYKIDPIMGELTKPLFEKECNLDKLIENLETDYSLSYQEKTKLIEKKNNQKSKKQSKQLADLAVLNSKTSEKVAEKSKTSEKTTSVKKAKSAEKPLPQEKTETLTDEKVPNTQQQKDAAVAESTLSKTVSESNENISVDEAEISIEEISAENNTKNKEM